MNPFRNFYVKIIIGLFSTVLTIVVAGDMVFYFLTGGERLFSFAEEGAAENTAESTESMEETVLVEAQEPVPPIESASAEGSDKPEAAAAPAEAAVLKEVEKDGETEDTEDTEDTERNGSETEAESYEFTEEQLIRPGGTAWNMRSESGDLVGDNLEMLMYEEEHEVSYPLMPLPPEDGQPDYFIRVNRALNCATVYARDEEGEYSIPYKVLLCSTGRNNRTPVGTFPLKERYRWRCMLGGVWSQYATRVYRGVLIHSVPYYTKNPGNLETHQYNRLGEQASAGCIRMNVRDAKWVYDHCIEGTMVEVYEDAEDPGPLGKPEPLRIEEDAEHPGWDPTDPEYPVDDSEEG